MNKNYKPILVVLLGVVAVLLSACSAEVGSDKWCAEMKEKPKGEWTASEAADFTKHCLLK